MTLARAPRIPAYRITVAAGTPTGYPPPLPPGTRVRRTIGGHTGTVQPHWATISRLGTFPVAWDSRVVGGRIWEICNVSDVEVIAEAPEPPQRKRRGGGPE